MTNQLYDVPLGIYAKRFAALDAVDVTARCGVAFSGGAFTVTLLGVDYRVTYPVFTVSPDANGKTKILLLRYLCEGTLAAHNGAFVAYRDISADTKLYDANFQGRCVKRLAFKFGKAESTLSAWRDIMRGLGAVESGNVGNSGTATFTWEIMPQLFMRFAVWCGEPDEGIAPSSQLLFSDNLPLAFSGEDLAVLGDLAIDAMRLDN